jgi:site-specific recombinase XerD
MSRRTRSARTPQRPMGNQHAWEIAQTAARAAAMIVRYGEHEHLATAVTFRHGSAMHQMLQGVPLDEVQRQSGHADLEATARYLRLASPERRAIRG